MGNNRNIKIAIPLAEEKLCLHFGHCECFILIDVNTEINEITNKQYLTPPPHQPGVLPKWLAEQGTNLVISCGMGMKAQSLFSEKGITVITGAPSMNPEDIVSAYLKDELESGENICDH